MAPESGRDSGGDLFDLAEKGTTVPEDSAKPRTIPSVPRPDQIASDTDPNNLGGRDLADAADNATDIPRTNQDTSLPDVLTGTGDTLPPQVDSKRLHNVPGGVSHDDVAKGSTRMTAHKVQPNDFGGGSDGPQADAPPGQEDLSSEQVMDQIERKEDV